MKTKKLFAKVVFTAAIIIFLSATSPQDAFADHGWRTLVGSWVVNVTPDGIEPPGDLPPAFTNLATVNWTRTIVAWDPDLGAGHGAWKRTGRRDFEIKFLILILSENPEFPPNSTLTVTAFLTVGDSGDEASGRVTGEFSNPMLGGIFATVDGAVSFTRIEVD